MAESVQGRWGYNDNKAIRRRAHSDGEEDEAEACKILGRQDEVDKSRATRDLQVPRLWYYNNSLELRSNSNILFLSNLLIKFLSLFDNIKLSASWAKSFG